MYGTSGNWGKTWGGIITSIINSVQIQILNTVYKKVAVALTGEQKGEIGNSNGRADRRESKPCRRYYST